MIALNPDLQMERVGDHSRSHAGKNIIPDDINLGGISQPVLARRSVQNIT
jgi:hypothetical protein